MTPADPLEKGDEVIEPIAVVCGIVGQDCDVVSGAAKGRCHRCNCEVWISPSTRSTLAHQPIDQVRFVCITCFRAWMAEGQHFDLMPPTQAQADELANYRKRETELN